MKKLKMKKNLKPGYLFTFCGLDGCGKTTIISKLVSELKNDYPIFLTKQPTDNVRTSEIFRTYMDCPDHSAYDYRSLSLLAASDRLQHTGKVIESEMDEGKIVLSDRYFYSCLANLRARGFERDRWIYEVAKEIIQPDISFFLDIPADTAICRVRSRPEERERYIDIDLQYKLRKEYVEICKANNGVMISTEMPFDKCYEIVKKEIESVIRNEY